MLANEQRVWGCEFLAACFTCAISRSSLAISVATSSSNDATGFGAELPSANISSCDMSVMKPDESMDWSARTFASKAAFSPSMGATCAFSGDGEGSASFE